MRYESIRQYRSRRGASGLSYNSILMSKQNDQAGDTTRPTALPVLDAAVRSVYGHHPRRWQDFHYVYPVVSRRSGGLSIGINLNIDKACNFDCIYCCVDRSVPPIRGDVDLEQVTAELDRMLELAVSGEIWEDEAFRNVPASLRRVNDIAFSGDGEPTAYPGFDEACARVIDRKKGHDLDGVKIVVITNATLLDRPGVRRALERLDKHGGEVWAKLDAGSEGYYQLVDQTRFPFQKVLDNILACGQQRKIVIQSLFMRVHSQPLPDDEYVAYLDRLEELLQSGCQIQLVQLYTTARRVAQPYVSPLSHRELDDLKTRLRQKFPALPVQVYYGVEELDPD